MALADTPAPLRQWTRHPKKEHSFRLLREMGVPVGTVIDVGILTSTYDLIKVYGDVHQVLIEPIIEFEDRIRANYDKFGIKYDLVQVAASDKDGETQMRTNSVRDGVEITHARMASDNNAPGEYRTVPMRKLDTIMAERNLDKPYLLKIDVDGAELEILKGAHQTLKDASVVCVETGIFNMFERAEAIRAYGFQIFDIVDICYYNNQFVQADLIFVKTEIIQERKLSVYQHGFDIKKWKSYDPS